MVAVYIFWNCTTQNLILYDVYMCVACKGLDLYASDSLLYL